MVSSPFISQVQTGPFFFYSLLKMKKHADLRGCGPPIKRLFLITRSVFLLFARFLIFPVGPLIQTQKMKRNVYFVIILSRL